MDISDSIVPRSDQANAEDFLSGPRTVTITGVNKGSAEQPVNIELAEFPGRPFRPSKTVRRILVNAWGAEASAYVGRRMTLYRDPAVKFGGLDVGGIRVSHLSHLDKPLTVALTVTRGKRAPYTVQPLVETAGAGRAEGEAAKPASVHPETAARRAAMWASLGEAFGEDDQVKREFIRDTIGHDFASTKELTPAEESKVATAARRLGRAS